jgi:hypothetical protein
MLRAHRQSCFNLRMQMPLGDSHKSRRMSPVTTLIPSCIYAFRDLRDRSRDTCEDPGISPSVAFLGFRESRHSVEGPPPPFSPVSEEAKRAILQLFCPESNEIENLESGNGNDGLGEPELMRIPSAILSLTNTDAAGTQSRRISHPAR